MYTKTTPENPLLLYSLLCYNQPTFFLFSNIFKQSDNNHVYTVEAPITDTLVSGQFYFPPPCLKPHLTPIQILYFYSLVIGHSCEWPWALSNITTETFSLFLKSRKQTPQRNPINDLCVKEVVRFLWLARKQKTVKDALTDLHKSLKPPTVTYRN